MIITELALWTPKSQKNTRGPPQTLRGPRLRTPDLEGAFKISLKMEKKCIRKKILPKK